MKKYHLTVILAVSSFNTEVEADNMYVSDNCYKFYIKTKFIASYPVNRTIISKVEDLASETLKNTFKEK